MKRLWSLALALLLVLALAACGGDQGPSDAEGPQSNNSPSNAEGPQGSNSPAESEDNPSVETDTPDAAVPNPEAGSKLVFTYNGCPLPMNAEFGPLLDYIGQPESYFEAPSCAFDGIDKTYTYAQIVVLTYPNEDDESIDYISSVRLLDDTISTPEGVSIGDKTSDVVAAYGSDYDDFGNQYSYCDGDTFLNFLLDGDTVTSIEYIAINDLLA